jgi:RNA polymerase-binding transcription factor DksA
VPTDPEGSQVTSIVHDPIDLLRSTLEEQFGRHTDRLAEYTMCSRLPGRGGHDPDTLAGLIATSRQAVADTAHALQRMADGTYGRCERCAAAITLQRLELQPHARLCEPCG